MKQKLALLISLVFASIITNMAYADDQGFYIGGNVGIGKPNITMPNGTKKSSSALGGIVLGYKFNPYLGVEGQYTGAGKVTDNVGGSAKIDAASIAAIGYLPLNETFDLYGKLGVAHTKTTLSASLAPLNNATRNSVVFGFGGEYHYDKNIGVRLGFDHYSAAVDNAMTSSKNVAANVASVGVVYQF